MNTYDFIIISLLIILVIVIYFRFFNNSIESMSMSKCDDCSELDEKMCKRCPNCYWDLKEKKCKKCNCDNLSFENCSQCLNCMNDNGICKNCSDCNLLNVGQCNSCPNCAFYKNMCYKCGDCSEINNNLIQADNQILNFINSDLTDNEKKLRIEKEQEVINKNKLICISCENCYYDEKNKRCTYTPYKNKLFHDQCLNNDCSDLGKDRCLMCDNCEYLDLDFLDKKCILKIKDTKNMNSKEKNKYCKKITSSFEQICSRENIEKSPKISEYCKIYFDELSKNCS